MNSRTHLRTRVAAFAVAALLAVFAMACEQGNGGDPLENGTEAPAGGTEESPTEEATP